MDVLKRHSELFGRNLWKYRVTSLAQFRAAGHNRNGTIRVNAYCRGGQRIGAGIAAGTTDAAAVSFRQRLLPCDALGGNFQILLQRAVKGPQLREKLFAPPGNI